MPQVKSTETKTKTKTSQITGVIAAVVAAIGIGALIYFAVVNYQQEIIKESTLPLLEQEYPTESEPIAPTKITDSNQIADYNAKIEKIVNSTLPVIEQQVQKTGQTSEEIINNTEKNYLVEESAEENASKTTTIIDNKINEAIEKGDIKSYNAEIIKDATIKTTLTNLNYTSNASELNIQTKLSNSENNTIQDIAETAADDAAQMNNTSAQAIASETNNDQNQISQDLNLEYELALDQILELSINNYNYEVGIAETEPAIEPEEQEEPAIEPEEQEEPAIEPEEQEEPAIEPEENLNNYSFYYCRPEGCNVTITYQAATRPEALELCARSGEYDACYDSLETCESKCLKPEIPDYFYCSKTDACVKVNNPNECIINGGDKNCVNNDSCCIQNKIPNPVTYNYCDQNDKANGCKQTEEFDLSSDLENFAACETKYGIGNCLTGKKDSCDATCKPDPVLDEINNGCQENLPNQPGCKQEVIDKLEKQPEEPKAIEEPQLVIKSKIIYRGLGRAIIKFWANPEQSQYFDYTTQKLAQDFKNNKLKVRFGQKKEDLSETLKIYKDPHNPNKYYAIAYKLNLDNLWQKDDGIYKSKKYYYQINSDIKKSAYFPLKSLQRAGEVLYVKNLLYNSDYSLTQDGGTEDVNLSNKGVPANNKKLANKIKKFENGGVYFWIQNSKVSPYGLRTAMAGDQRYKQFYNILKNLKNKNNINKAVKILYYYHDRLRPTDIYRRYDIEGIKYWAKQVQKGNLSFNAMVTYVMLGTDEPLQNLKQFWGTGKVALKKAETELSFVKALSRGITQQSDISRFSSNTKYPSSASIRGDLRNSDEFRNLLKDIYKREGESGAIALLYIADLGRPIDPDGQPYYVDKFNKLRTEGLSPTDALNEIDKELTSSAEYQNALNRPIK